MQPVPSQRLLWLCGMVVIVAAAAGPLRDLVPFALIVAAAVAVVALADLVLSWRVLRPVAVKAPGVTRFSKDRPGTLAVTFVRSEGGPRHLRFGLAIPASFVSEVDHINVDLPADSPTSRVEWKLRPTRRGLFRSPLACQEFGSLAGLWALRHREVLDAELRVYPNLFTERKQLAALFLARGPFGAKLQRTVGRGREFEKLRDYLPGDGFDEVHWKATAKRGRPITKVFQTERTQEIYVVIDASRLSARSVVHEGVTQTALERYLTASLVLLLAARRQGDRFGLVVYDDRARVYVRPGGGAAHYAACREALYGLVPSEAAPDMAEIIRFLRSRIRRRSLLFFLTDLTDPVLAEDFERHAGLLARQHLVLVNQLRAPGVAPLFHRDEVKDSDEVFSRLAGHTRWQELQSLFRRLKPQGVTAALLEDEGLAAQLVRQYLMVKQRQLL